MPGRRAPMRAVVNKLTSGFLLGLLVGPLAAEPQPTVNQARIGYLGTASEPSPPSPPFMREAFFETLGQHGWVQGKNLLVESRYAAGVLDALPRLAAELAASRVDLIVALSSAPAALAAKRATSTIPVVFTTG